MKPRSVFLASQGWTCLVREDEDGLWRSPGGGVVRAAEAEDHAMTLMTRGLAYWFARCEEQAGANKTAVSLIKSAVARMVLEELHTMWQDPAFQQQAASAIAEAMASNVSVREVLRRTVDGKLN